MPEFGDVKRFSVARLQYGICRGPVRACARIRAAARAPPLPGPRAEQSWTRQSFGCCRRFAQFCPFWPIRDRKPPARRRNFWVNCDTRTTPRRRAVSRSISSPCGAFLAGWRADPAHADQYRTAAEPFMPRTGGVWLDPASPKSGMRHNEICQIVRIGPSRQSSDRVASRASAASRARRARPCPSRRPRACTLSSGRPRPRSPLP